MLEQRIVKNVLNCLSGILTELNDPKDADPSEGAKISNQVALAVEMSAIRRKRPSVPKVPLDLVMQNLTQVGFFGGSIRVVSEMAEYFIERHQELRRQEAEFWTVKNRPPNYYARTIALRFAKFFARQKGAKPTFGTSKDGGQQLPRRLMLNRQSFACKRREAGDQIVLFEELLLLIAGELGTLVRCPAGYAQHAREGECT